MLKSIFPFIFQIFFATFSIGCVSQSITVVCSNNECIKVNSDLIRLSGPINEKLGDRFADLLETTVHLPLFDVDIISQLITQLMIATQQYSPSGKTLAGNILTKEHMFFKEQNLLEPTYEHTKKPTKNLTLKESILLLNAAYILELPVIEKICIIRFLEKYTSDFKSKKFKAISGKKLLKNKINDIALEHITMKFLSYERLAKKKLKEANLSLSEQLILAKAIEKNNLSYLYVPIHTLIVETIKKSEDDILDDARLTKLIIELRNLKQDFFKLKTYDINLSQHHTTLAILGEMLKRNFKPDVFVKLFNISNSFNLPYLETALKLHLERIKEYNNKKFKLIWKQLPEKLKQSYKNLGYEKTKPDFSRPVHIKKNMKKRYTFS